MTAIETFGYLCTGCPLGCRLEVDAVEGDIIEIRGFECAKGERYAHQEHTDPRRPVSSTVAISGSALPRLPVRTVEAVPRDIVRQVAVALRDVRVRAPVRRGDVVLADVLGTGIDVIATRGMRRAVASVGVPSTERADRTWAASADEHPVDDLIAEEPHSIGIDDREPDAAHTEAAHLLAGEARDILREQGFTDSQILHWADAYIRAEHSGDVDVFLAWISVQEHGASVLRTGML